MLLFRIISISLWILVSGSISIGSDSEALMSCSKFHFEEKVLEKLIRLEHKMEINEEKLKKWEDAFSSKLDKMEEAIKRTEIFVETVRENQLQEQSRLNESFQEIVDHFNIQSKNVTEIHDKQMDIMLKSLSSKIEEFSVAEKKRENTLGSMQNTLHQEQKRFNQSFDIKVRQSMKQTETFEKSMRDIQLQELSRLNNSYLEIVEHFKIQSKNVTEIHGKQMDIMLKSLSSKLEEFSEAEKNRKRNLESMQNTLHQDQQRFNQSFDLALQNIRLSTNRTVHEQIAQQKRGVYHITAVVMSVSGKNLYLHLKHNNEYTAGSYITGGGHKTGTFDVVLSLQKGVTLSVGSGGSYTVYSDSTKYTTFSGHLIA
ncbi:SLK [Mytilus edulis]|uniref:SLK n=1 Tax=Mytilus edulis TaxID=6550 RepID=A0A8S3TT88_MYTED|nr:SLK [Mytilus edulis]